MAVRIAWRFHELGKHCPISIAMFWGEAVIVVVKLLVK